MLSRLYGVLLPFFVSFLLAYLLDPVVDFVQNKCKVRFRGLSVMIDDIVSTTVIYPGGYLDLTPEDIKAILKESL